MEKDIPTSILRVHYHALRAGRDESRPYYV